VEEETKGNEWWYLAWGLASSGEALEVTDVRLLRRTQVKVCVSYVEIPAQGTRHLAIFSGDAQASGYLHVEFTGDIT